MDKDFNKKIVTYIVVSFGFSWAIWFPMMANQLWNANFQLISMQYYLASFGPLIGSVVTNLLFGGYRELVKWLSRAFSLKFPLKWLFIAIILPIIYGLIAIPLDAMLTGEWIDWSKFGLTSKLAGLNLIQTYLVWVLTFGLGEEGGWRGYLLPQLTKKYSMLKSSFIVALIWIIWHIPVFTFNSNFMNMGFGIIGWIISLIYGSVLLSWICKGSRWSIIPVLVWHGEFDLLTASDQSADIIAIVCSMLVVIHSLVLLKKRSLNEENIE